MFGKGDGDEKFMRMALDEAKVAYERGEVPIGAVLVERGRVVSKGHNRSIELKDPTAHAEILVLRRAAEIMGNYRLKGTTLYVTSEPCPMCAFAMVSARISRLVYGALEPKYGAVESKVRLLVNGLFNHNVEVEGGVLKDACAELMRTFFRERRATKKTAFLPQRGE